MILGFGNNVKGLIAADITANTTVIPVMPGTGALFASILVPDSGLANPSLTPQVYAKVTLTDERETIFEICHLLSVSGDRLTVLRGQEGTTARTWYIGDTVANFATRGSENLFVQVEDLQSGKYTACVAGGTENALTADLPTSFFDNGRTGPIVLRTPLYIIPVADNTGPVTLLVMMSGRVIGTYPVVKGNNAPLKAGDIVAGLPALMVFSAALSAFQVMNPATAPLDVAEGDKNYLRIDNNLSEIADNGPGARKAARDNLDLDRNYLRIDKNLGEIAGNGAAAQKSAREHIDVVDGTLVKKGLVQLTDLSKPEDEDSTTLALTPAGLKKVTDIITPLTIPVGGIIEWPASVPPEGWLEANGQVFDKAKYPALALVLPSGRVPDLRGKFVRGWAHGSAADPDSARAIGSEQAASVESHSHGVALGYNGDGGNGKDNSPPYMRLPQPQISTLQTSAYGGGETRPVNIALMYIVKTDEAKDVEPTPTPDAVTVTPALITGGVGDRGKITAQVLPASMAGEYPVTFTSSDTGIITVDSGGNWQITGGGNAWITASISTGMGATVTVNAYVMLTAVSIAPVPEMTENGTYTLQLTRTPSGSNEPLLYYSTDDSVASVSNGIVYAYNPGTAVISVAGQYSGVSGSQSVTVKPVVVEEEYLRIDNNLSEIAGNGPAAQKAARDNLALGTAATCNAEDFLPSDYKPPVSGVSSVNGKTGVVQLGAADVGAVPVTGGTMTGELVINVDDEAIRLKKKSTSAACFIRCTDSTNANHWYIGAGSKYEADTTFQNYKGGNNSIILKGDGAVTINPMNGKVAAVNGPLQVGTTGSAVLNIGDSDSGLRNARDGQVDLWANNKAVGSWNGTAFSFTGQMIPTDYANFDARYQAKDSPTGGAYTKAESDARYQQDTRLGARNYQLMTKGMMFEVAGNVITGLQIEGQVDGDGDYIVLRPLQKKINDTWYTVDQI
ncbi:tail fiber protein [Enterobacter ludwigii]